MYVESKEKTPTELPKLEHNKVLNIWDRANIMKIIPTWPKACVPRFHQMALQDWSSCSNPEELFGET